MKCENCELLKNFDISDSGASITCAVNGKFKLARDFFDSFECKEYLQEEEKPKEIIVYFVLKNGATMKTKTNLSMKELCEEFANVDFFADGETCVRTSEVAAFRRVEE